MTTQKKSRKAYAGLFNSAGKFASRNRTALGVAGAGLATAAALFLGRRYRDQRQGQDQSIGAAAI
jgi:hypothetical protein